MTSPLRIGTRGSRLALWQANYVVSRLQPLVDARPIQLVEIQTAGDQVRDVPLPEIGGEGVFTKEIQRALLDERVDVAVHSLKDLPTVTVPGLTLAAVPPRGPANDVFVSKRYLRFDDLKAGTVVATSSLRRRAQLLYRRPDLRVTGIRGNVETRLRVMEQEGLDGLILAEAGLARLGLEETITERLDLEWMLPAVGQGALGLECRELDHEVLQLLEQLDDRTSRQQVLAERALLQALGGGCQVPIGAISTIAGETLLLRCAVLDPSGRQRVEAQMDGPAEKAEELGTRLAEVVLARGAGQLLGI